MLLTPTASPGTIPSCSIQSGLAQESSLLREVMSPPPDLAFFQPIQKKRWGVGGRLGETLEKVLQFNFQKTVLYTDKTQSHTVHAYGLSGAFPRAPWAETSSSIKEQAWSEPLTLAQTPEAGTLTLPLFEAGRGALRRQKTCLSHRTVSLTVKVS
jgi:hypothetical protein